ncbi:uncharacterized protein METZ01_LOCUS222243 [marine metagenome]|uniref:Uncharacterized protein n=1 Tax=marine metagenome TaxID=408172 RepID=A0A382G3D3_9ZZZZ
MAIETRSELCPHHWVIDTPNGPTSIGTCKMCGEKQEFVNSLMSVGWEKVTSYGRTVNSTQISTAEKTLTKN